jgi:hypothetical protein
MAIQHELNELSAERAAEMVRVSDREQDSQAVANGARTTAEVIFRTLGKLGVDLPVDFPEALIVEFDSAVIDEGIAMARYHDDVQRFAVS